MRRLAGKTLKPPVLSNRRVWSFKQKQRLVNKTKPSNQQKSGQS